MAGVGALSGGVAGAVIAGRLSTDDTTPTAAARDEPVAAVADRPAAIAASAGRSASRQPTPWPIVAERAAAIAVHHPRHRAAVVRATPVAVRDTAARIDVPAETVAAPTVQTSTPAATDDGAAVAPVDVPVHVRQPSTPARSPEPAPTPTPQAAPKAPSPEPAPAGSVDNAG